MNVRTHTYVACLLFTNPSHICLLSLRNGKVAPKNDRESPAEGRLTGIDSLEYTRHRLQLHFKSRNEVTQMKV